MHKIIVVFIVAILVMNAPIDSFAKKKSISKTNQNVEKQAEEKSKEQPEQKKAKIFSTIPFALSGNIIPQDYLGHDLRAVYKALEARRKNKKSEFETTAEFNERIAREEKLPLIGSINMDDNFALLVKTESTYDADNKSLKISLPFAHSRERKFALGIEGQQIDSSIRKYVGSNAYGATVDVTEYFREDAVLVVENSSAFNIKDDSFAINIINVTLSDISVENAKKIKGNLSAICVFKLDYPFLGEDKYYSKATIDDPNETISNYKLVHGNISEIIVFDNKSGQILHRYGYINKTVPHPNQWIRDKLD